MVTRDIANYLGELIEIGGGLYNSATPLFDLTSGNIQRRNSMTIPMSVLVTPAVAAQNAVTEVDSGASIASTDYTRSQITNVMQIMAQSVQVTDVKMASTHEREGANADGTSTPMNELDFQVNSALRQIKMDIEYSMLNGTYVADGGSAVSSQTAGLLEVITTNTTDVGAVDLTKALLDALLNKAIGNGAKFEIPAILCGAREQTIINDVYSYAMQSTNVGGTNIQNIITPRGVFRVVYMPTMPAGSLVVGDLKYIKPSFLPTPAYPGQVVDVYNPQSGIDVKVLDVASGGASVKRHIQTVFGLDYGNEALHASLTNLKTA